MSPASVPDPDSDLATHRTAAGLLALLSLPGLGSRTALKIAQGNAPAALAHQYLSDPNLPAALTTAEEVLAAHQDAAITVLGFFDPAYPPRLRQIPDPPPLLYVRGNLELLAAPKLAAVIGTRKPSAAGATTTDQLTSALAAAGFSILSGLAQGVDAIAHRTALKAGAANLAVLAGGLERISPAANRPLAEQILSAGGALLSENPLGTPTLPANLITRNRLQSGLADLLLIIECEARSGSLHTARYAAAQGRPIFVPPDTASGGGEGTRLLRNAPASELPDVLPAFAEQRALCERLGPQPLAQPLDLDHLDAALATAGARTGPAFTQLSFQPSQRSVCLQLNLLQA
jgi:DNA processing protein